MITLQKKKPQKPANLSIIKEYNTLIEARIFYLPLLSRNPIGTKVIENNSSIYKVDIINPLSPIYHDILDCIKKTMTVMPTTDQSIRAEFTPYAVLKLLKHKKSTNYNWLYEKINELCSATFNIEIIRDKEIKRILIEKIGTFEIINGRCNFTFTESYLNFFIKEPKINYMYFLDKILEIKSIQLRSIVKYLLTFNEASFRFKTLITNIFGENVSKQQRYKIKELLMQNEKYLKEEFNITIFQEEKVLYINKHELENIYILSQKTQQVWFS
jgi:hypothetical protein